MQQKRKSTHSHSLCAFLEVTSCFMTENENSFFPHHFWTWSTRAQIKVWARSGESSKWHRKKSFHTCTLHPLQRTSCILSRPAVRPLTSRRDCWGDDARGLIQLQLKSKQDRRKDKSDQRRGSGCSKKHTRAVFHLSFFTSRQQRLRCHLSADHTLSVQSEHCI